VDESYFIYLQFDFELQLQHLCSIFGVSEVLVSLPLPDLLWLIDLWTIDRDLISYLLLLEYHVNESTNQQYGQLLAVTIVKEDSQWSM
jgi:hypothetical protein